MSLEHLKAAAERAAALVERFAHIGDGGEAAHSEMGAALEEHANSLREAVASVEPTGDLAEPPPPAPETKTRYATDQVFTRPGSDVRFTSFEADDGTIVLTPVAGGPKEVITRDEWANLQVMPDTTAEEGIEAGTTGTETETA